MELEKSATEIHSYAVDFFPPLHLEGMKMTMKLIFATLDSLCLAPYGNKISSRNLWFLQGNLRIEEASIVDLEFKD